MATYFVLFLAVLAAGVGYIIYDLYKIPEVPNIDMQKWWGDGDRPIQEATNITPLKIVFSDSMIEDLKTRLRNRRPFTRPLDGVQSEYGINTNYLNNVLNYWQDKYNFKDRMESLNKFTHFKTNIQGLDIHFIRARSQGKGKVVLPLLIMHGWPSSSKEFDKIIPMLTEDKKDYDFVFDVIAPDLPGFGFSQGTNKTGLNQLQIGIIMKNLMQRLGYEKFYIHAGDWGSQVGTHMATLFQDNILGFHTTLAIAPGPISVLKYIVGSLLFPTLIVEKELLDRISPLKDVLRYLIRESGYFHIQATKSDTIGAALTDTPVGIAAYILEKIGVCCNRDRLNTPHGGLDEIHIDDLLDTVTIMWANECITTCTRIYAEGFQSEETSRMDSIPTQVPTASVNFRHEVLLYPDWVLKDKFPNLVRSTKFNYGGHFAALQTPKELVDEIFKSVTEFIKFHNKK